MARTSKATQIAAENAAIETMITPGNDVAGAPTEATDAEINEVIERIGDSVESMIDAPAEVTTKSKADDQIALDELIPCKSITYAVLGWTSPQTRAKYRWNNIGAVAYIPFSELITMYNTSQQYITKPKIIIQDARVVRHFRLLPIYETAAQIHNLDKVLKQPAKAIDATITAIKNVGMRTVAISKIREMIASGELTNIRVIKRLESGLSFDFSDDISEGDE